MDTQETTLLPCPFCASGNIRKFAPTCKRGSVYDPTDRAYPIVRCMDCFAEACGENWDNKCKTAINSWNLRDPAAPSPALALAQEALRELHTLVWGECPSLLNEDSGGYGELDISIRAIIEGTPHV